MRFKQNEGVEYSYQDYNYYDEYGYHNKYYSRSSYSKKDDFVEYPITGLDLKDYCSKEIGKEGSIYDLYGVIHHSGSVHCGHYWATIKNDIKSDKWYEFNGKKIDVLKTINLYLSLFTYLLIFNFTYLFRLISRRMQHKRRC